MASSGLGRKRVFEQTLYWLSVTGVAVFALSGALAAAEKQLDVLAFLLFAVIAGIGGGTVRDVLIDRTVFWIESPIYLYLCFCAAIISYLTAPFLRSALGVFLWVDAIGLALFSVIGAAKSMDVGLDPLVCTVMGVITATFGSIIRDVILNEEPLLLGPDIYVTAALMGSGIYVAMEQFGWERPIAMLTAVFIAFLLRAAAIVFGWRLPSPSDH